MSKYPKSWPVGGHPEAEAKVRQMQKVGSPWMRASGPGWVAEKQGKLSNVKVEKGGPFVVLSWVEGLYNYNAGVTPYRQRWVVLDATTLNVKSRGVVEHGTKLIDNHNICAVAVPSGFVKSMFSGAMASGVQNPANFYKPGQTLVRVFEATAKNMETTLRVFSTRTGEYLAFQACFEAGGIRNYYSMWRDAEGEVDNDGVLRIASPFVSTPPSFLRTGARDPVDYAHGRFGRMVPQSTRISWLRWMNVEGFVETGSRRYADSTQPSPYHHELYDYSIGGHKPLLLTDESAVDLWAVCLERSLEVAGEYALRFYNTEETEAQRLELPFGNGVMLSGVSEHIEPQAVTCTPRGVLVATHSRAFDTLPYRASTPMDHVLLSLYSTETGELLREKQIRQRPENEQSVELPDVITPSLGSGFVQMYTVWP